MPTLPDHLCVADVEYTAPAPREARRLTRGESIAIAAWLPSVLSALTIASVVFS